MNRSSYFDTCELKLSTLATRIEIRGGLNILDLNIQTEYFYSHFLKVLFGWEIENLNSKQQNVAGIDLIDNKNKIIIQVSATATKHKIESALAKDLSAYAGYNFKFISISKDVSRLRPQSFLNPHGLTFFPPEDIIDIPSLLKIIISMDVDRQKEVKEFLDMELKIEPDPEKVESNLAKIIILLAKEDWNTVIPDFETRWFDIETKIQYNQLVTARTLIDDYKIHCSRIEKIYSDFDKLGANKSLSILNGIRTEYLNIGSAESPDQYFFLVIDMVTKKIRESVNYVVLPDEELALCVQILVVDAFIRCKIFKNPFENTDAHTR